MVEVVRGHQISQARVIAHVGDTRDPHRARCARSPAARSRRPVGDTSGGPGAARLPAARDDGSPRRHDREPARSEARVGPAARGSFPDRSAPATPRCGCDCPRCSRCRPPRSRSSATSCRSGSARRSASVRAATASTTRCASRTGCRPNGCSPTCASTRSPTASGTASSTSGPRTAPCSAPRASRRSCAPGATSGPMPLTELEGDVSETRRMA